MDTVRIPKVIQFGKDALSQAEYPKNALVVTTVPPELSDKWLGRMGIQDYLLYDKVQPEPSIEMVNQVIDELVSIKDPVYRELNARSLSEIMGVSADSVFHALHSSINRNNRQAEFRQQTAASKQTQPEKNQLLENDLLRLCFGNNKKIRQYLFEFVNKEWFISQQTHDIFEKVYIHLHSENIPQTGVVMDELNNEKDRKLLADLLYDIDNVNPTLTNAQECVLRMEKNWIDRKIGVLREELRNSESSNFDTIPIMKQIEKLQMQKKTLSYHELSD